MKNSILLVAMALAGAVATAQPVIGTVTDVKGLVTATVNDKLVTLSNGDTITNLERIVSAATGNITINIDGCSITLTPNKSLTVDQSRSCQQLRAAIADLPPTANSSGMGGGFASSFGAGLGVITFAGIVQYIAYRDTPASLR
jgi:hypothetical protein